MVSGAIKCCLQNITWLRFHELIAAVIICTGPAQDRAHQHSTMDGRGLLDPTALQESTGDYWLLEEMGEVLSDGSH